LQDAKKSHPKKKHLHARRAFLWMNMKMKMKMNMKMNVKSPLSTGGCVIS